MAITHVQDSTPNTGTSTSFTLTLASGVSVNDLVVVTIGYATFGTAPTFTTTTGTSSAWSQLQGSDGANQRSIVAYATVNSTSSGSFAVQVAWAGGVNMQAVLSDFSGVGSNDQHNSNTGSGSGSSAPTGSITPSASSQYLFLAECSASGVTTVSSVPTGYTAIGSTGLVACGAYQITSSSSAQNPSFTLSTALPGAWAANVTDFLAPALASGPAGTPLVVSRQAIASAF